MRLFKRLLVTGGAGFIGSAFIRYGLKRCPDWERVVNLDLLTYAADPTALKEVEEDPRYHFVRGDIRDERLVTEILQTENIDVIVHFAAESHVDRSIEGPQAFFETNVRGTLALLEVLRRFPQIHFHHVSTDEVYGSLGETGYFSEESPYRPNSPYSASKAASDHCVRAYAHTYGLKTTTSHCSNNYGPFQHREKFIPRLILACLEKKSLPIYGDGCNIRDWLYVDDHIEAILAILREGKIGEVYDIGGACEKKNLDVARTILATLGSSEKMITFIPDRPGHDFRYAIDASKIQQQLGWTPRHSFELGLQQTIHHYAHCVCHSCTS